MSSPDTRIAVETAALKPLLGQRLSLSKSDLDLHGRPKSYFPVTPPMR